ncbi:MAG: M23 family metallopeptidase [Salibacteraceae bacterium]|nr:M23 family metallopeptidase [Salibacteraceae bacterium]|tara:strand:- start:30286 stop:31257 length:972 start_codon:yes stop_codon:yes gene_type:complete
MASKKYKYNTKTLSYEQIELTAKDRLFKLVTYTLSGIVFATLFLIVTFFFFDTPEERQLKRENEKLVHEYELLNNKLENVSKVLSNIQERDDNIYRVILEAEPIADNLRKSGIGGVNRYAQLEGYNNSSILIKTAKKLDELTKQIYIQSKSFDEVLEMASKKEQMLASIPSIMPLKSEDLKRISSGFGIRMHPILKIRKMHEGQDFTAPTGTQIFATGSGTVSKVEKRRFGFGFHVIVDHGYGYKTIYAHMSRINIRKGQKVNRGDVLGLVGSTGSSTAPHLHYEVLKNGVKIDPVNYYYQDLSPDQFQQIIDLSDQPIQSFD